MSKAKNDTDTTAQLPDEFYDEDGALQLDKLVTGRTPEERALIARVTNNVKASVHLDRKVNLGNYNSMGFGFTIGMPLGLTDEEYDLLLGLYEEGIQRAIDILNGEIERRVAKIEAQLAAKKSKSKKVSSKG